MQVKKSLRSSLYLQYFRLCANSCSCHGGGEGDGVTCSREPESPSPGGSVEQRIHPDRMQHLFLAIKERQQHSTEIGKGISSDGNLLLWATSSSGSPTFCSQSDIFCSREVVLSSKAFFVVTVKFWKKFGLQKRHVFVSLPKKRTTKNLMTRTSKKNADPEGKYALFLPKQDLSARTPQKFIVTLS